MGGFEGCFHGFPRIVGFVIIGYHEIVFIIDEAGRGGGIDDKADILVFGDFHVDAFGAEFVPETDQPFLLVVGGITGGDGLPVFLFCDFDGEGTAGGEAGERAGQVPEVDLLVLRQCEFSFEGDIAEAVEEPAVIFEDEFTFAVEEFVEGEATGVSELNGF